MSFQGYLLENYISDSALYRSKIQCYLVDRVIKKFIHYEKTPMQSTEDFGCTRNIWSQNFNVFHVLAEIGSNIEWVLLLLT